MAIESERLLAIFEAKFSSLDKALSKARGDANKAFGDIEAAGNRAENVLAKVGSRGTPGIDKMSKSVNALRGQTGNLAAQFNDIGVQLASGTSPFLIAIQQGSQINQVLGQAGAGGAVRALGGAFFSLINPVSLATIATIGLGGAAVQYFASLLSDGEEAKTSLKEQADAVQKVADKWGDALPAVKAYADELTRQADAAERLTAINATIAHSFEPINSAITEVGSQLAGLSTQFYQVGGAGNDLSNQVYDAQLAIGNLERKTKDGTATTEDYNAVLEALSALAGTDAVQANYALAQSIGVAAQAAIDGAKQLAEYNNQIAKLAAPAGTEPRHRKTLDEAQAEFDQGLALQRRINPEAFDDIKHNAPPKSRRRGGGGGSRQSDYQREVQQIQQRTAAIEAQTTAQAGLDPLVDDFGRTLETARAKQELLNAAQQAGIAITPEMSAQIDALASSYGVAYAEAQKLAKSQDEARRTAQEFNELSRDTFGTFISDLVHGKNATDALRDAVGRLGDRLLDLSLDSLFGTGRGGGSGLFGGIFGAIGHLFGFAKGGVAAHGRPRTFASGGVSNSAAIFGEAGPEAAVPLPDGRRIPVELRMPAMPQFAKPSSNDTVRIMLQDDSGRMADIADQRIRTASGAIVHIAVTQAKNQVVPTMAAYQRDQAGGDYRG
jgi:hypothetical protein